MVVRRALDIEFLADIVLTAALPPLANPETTIIELPGNGHTLDGHGHGPILSIGPDTSVTVERLTLTGGVTPGADGCSGAAFVAGLLSLRDSVVSGNSAARGGGLCVIGQDEYADLILNDSVVTGNTAQLGGGGIFARAEGGATVILGIYDSTLSRNRAIAANAPEGRDCWQPISSDGYNLDGVTSCDFFHVDDDRPGGRADLLPLALNSPGATATHALGPDSEARDRVPPEEGLCGPLETDQRGVTRPQPIGGGCDIGAYEASDE